MVPEAREEFRREVGKEHFALSSLEGSDQPLQDLLLPNAKTTFWRGALLSPAVALPRGQSHQAVPAPRHARVGDVLC